VKKRLYLKQIVKNNGGFTLIEMIIVIVILSVMSLLVVPRLSNFFGNKRENFIILTSMIAKTFDDSFINDRINFFSIHLFEPGMEVSDSEDERSSRNNGISVMTLDDNGNFVDSDNKLMKYRQFPDSFRLEEVVLSSGERIGIGTVMVPYYPQGYSDNVILHILTDDEDQWSVRFYKFQKDASIFHDYINFDEL